MSSPAPKLLILTLGRRGGSVRYATSIINAMTRVEKTVYSSSFCIEEAPLGAFKIKTYRNKFEFILSSLFVLPWIMLKVMAQLWMGKFNILYTPYTHHWNCVFIILFKAFGLKTVSTVHDGIPHVGDGNKFQKWINRITLDQSDQLIFLTEYVRDFLKQRVGYRAQCRVIPHGIIRVEGACPKIKSHPKKFNLLFLGRICQYKGVDLLMDALQYLDANQIASIVIAGEVNDLQKHLKQKSTRIPVKWMDKWLTEQEMSEQLSNAHILVLPYREATQSGVMTIGIASGLPMVCTKTGGLREQCNETECLFVDSHAKAIAEGIQRYIDFPEAYQSIQHALEIKRRSLSWDIIANDIVEFIQIAD